MKRICEINQWTPEFIVTPFDGIISGLKSYKYDCIISAMTITPQRQAVVDFTQSYYNAGQIVAVPLQDSTIKSVDDLRAKKVGVQLGTTGERYAKSLQGVTVFSFDNIGAAFIDMENGQIDAVLNDYPTTMEYIKLKGMAKTVGELLSEESYGIAVRRGDSELLERLDAALKQIIDSGEYEKIKSRWF
jgi:polar amino acid transport system substrate-binding protein